MENQEQTKKCIHCGRELPISSFNKCSRSADGLQSYCKDCHREENSKARARRKSEVDGIINRCFSGNRHGADENELAQYSARQLLAELKRRGYVWENMYVKMKVEYQKI